jgi:LmbE family N-acetylglucosaminyl deacetylase
MEIFYMSKTVLAIGAHPDDIELLAAGTVVLLKNKGWNVHLATMTDGGKGSVELSSEEIGAIRKKEAAASASLVGAGYDCMGAEDLFILYNRDIVVRTTKLIREVKPDVVITMSPVDYSRDHEETSKIVQTACFSAGIKLLDTDGVEPFDQVPYLYYMDSLEGKDNFGNDIKPGIIIDISTVMDMKEKMLASHASQREWLREHHGMDEYINQMKSMSAARGALIGKSYGEGFRQHLGHAFPQDDILKAELGDDAYVI